MKRMIHLKPEKIQIYIKKLRESDKVEKIQAFSSDYWLLSFFIGTIAYLELLYRLWIFKGLSADYIFPFLFAFSAGTVLFLITGLIPGKSSGMVAAALTFLLCLVYAVQIIYYCIFRTPLSLYSVGGAGDAAQFSDIVAETVFKNSSAVMLAFVPSVMLVLRKGKHLFAPMRRTATAYVLLFCVASYSAAIICVNLTNDSPASQSTLYYKASNPELSVSKLGLLTTMRLDLQNLVEDSVYNNFSGEAVAAGTDALQEHGDAPGTDGKPDNPTDSASIEGGAAEQAAANNTRAGRPEEDNIAEGDNGGEAAVPEATVKPYNTMDIDFKTLLASGKDDNLFAMNKYFSTVNPTATNRYTGMFRGDNLILITAEAFSPYFITRELTPTLYRMATEGFVFKNFYNPVWGVSTSDGEYVGCTGLIPKSGVWSFARSGANYMPFCLGNQFSKLGYVTKAYHDHTNTYYKRDISHPNMGYDYKGFGNGLVVKKTWPESDLEMINVTAGDFTSDEPFHIYYMTVSGHMNYSFSGNYIAGKNRKLVENLPYSDASKAYIACNLELEFAMKALLEKLEAAGVAGKTVVALSGDHYPYGLPRENIDELAGHKVEEKFELYKSTFILWEKGMDTVVVDKPCASLDRIPTLSNLFGLEYDSRLMMGTDILSDSPALVIFSNRSWITDRARYNSVADHAEFLDGTAEDKTYVRKVNRIVADKFKYSARILETDYYGKLFQKNK